MDKEPLVDISQVPGMSNIEIHTELDGKEISRMVSEHLDKIPYGRLAQDLRCIADEEPPMSPQPKHSGVGVIIAMLAWTIVFMVFPGIVKFPVWLADVFYLFGLATMLMAILGLCVEVFKGKS